MKICSNKNCKKINPQPLVNFCKYKRTKDGLMHRCRNCFKEYYRKNKKKIDSYNRKYVKMHLDRIYELQRKYCSNWRKRNSGKVNAYNAKIYTSKLKRTPQWLSKKQLKEIENFYIKAKELSLQKQENYEVDHIVPLNGKNVSGLHVPWNLQILPKLLNLKKGNRL